MPEEKFVAGIAPELKTWLEMRRKTRAHEEKFRGKQGLETALPAHDIKSMFHSYWTSKILKPEVRTNTDDNQSEISNTGDNNDGKVCDTAADNKITAEEVVEVEVEAETEQEAGEKDCKNEDIDDVTEVDDVLIQSESIEPRDLVLGERKWRSIINAYQNGALSKQVIFDIAGYKRSNRFIQILLEAGFDINRPGPLPHGRSLLHIACYEGELKKVHYLLSNGAAVNTRDLRRNTPLHEAIRPSSIYHSLDILVFLIQNGADVNATNNHGQTAMHIACALFDLRIVKVLLIHGAAAISILDKNNAMPIDLIKKVSLFYFLTIYSNE